MILWIKGDLNIISYDKVTLMKAFSWDFGNISILQIPKLVSAKKISKVYSRA